MYKSSHLSVVFFVLMHAFRYKLNEASTMTCATILLAAQLLVFFISLNLINVLEDVV